MISVKFKFLHKDFWEKDYPFLYKDFVKVENPIGIPNLPRGEYMIRGNQKSHRKEYYHLGNEIWLLIEDVIKDNGHYFCDAATYELFPNLPEKEWDKIRSCAKYLNRDWQRKLSGHDFWMDLRRLTREMKKDFLKDELRNN